MLNTCLLNEHTVPQIALEGEKHACLSVGQRGVPDHELMHFSGGGHAALVEGLMSGGSHIAGRGDEEGCGEGRGAGGGLE